MDKQEQLHEKYRLMMNEKTDNAINAVKDIANPKSNEELLNYFMNFKKQPSISNKPTMTTAGIPEVKDKKYLETKVIKLLNDMQVQS